LTGVEADYPSPYVMVVKEFDKGIITLGLWDGGLFIEDGSRLLSFKGEGGDNDIGHSVVYFFLEDKDGSMWIGTNGDGVFRTDSNKHNYLYLTSNLDDPMGLDSGKINFIYKDDEGKLWVSIYNMGLNIYDPATEEIKKYNMETGLPNDQIVDFLNLSDTMYLASGEGIIRYDKGSETFTSTEMLPKDYIVYTLVMDKDDHLWIGTYQNGLYEFDENQKQVNHYDVTSDIPLQDNLLYDLFIDSRNRLWIGTNNGLNMLDMETKLMTSYVKSHNETTSLPGNVVRTIYESRDGVMWFGLDGGGVSRYLEETESFISYTETTGLADNSVNGLVEAEDGTIWAATLNGISVIDPSDNSIMTLQTSFSQTGGYFTSDGWVDETGAIYFGGTAGVVRIPSSVDLDLGEIPPLYITEMQVMNNSIDEKLSIFNGENYTLDADEILYLLNLMPWNMVPSTRLFYPSR